MINSEKCKISIIIVTYNSKNHIKKCIESIRGQSYPKNYLIEIIIVDNLSTDGTPDFIRENFPLIKIIKSEENNGYGYGNNLGVKHATGEYVIILNPDTIVEKGWLEELISPLRKNDKLITTPKILVYNGSMINGCGLIIHFTGLGFTRGLNSEKSNFMEPEYVNGIFGCCFAIKKRHFIELGGFDKNIFLYEEDVDLSYRAHLSHFKVLFIPSAVIRHDYVLNVEPQKIYYLEKGRYILLRKYMLWKDIVFLFPSLVIAELLTFGYSFKFGFEGLKYKFKAINDGFSIKITKIQGNKYERTNFFKSLDTKIPVDQLTFNKAEAVFKMILNRFFELNWAFFKIMSYNYQLNAKESDNRSISINRVDS